MENSFTKSEHIGNTPKPNRRIFVKKKHKNIFLIKEISLLGIPESLTGVMTSRRAHVFPDCNTVNGTNEFYFSVTKYKRFQIPLVLAQLPL